jgi:hypothetical protein
VLGNDWVQGERDGIAQPLETPLSEDVSIQKKMNVHGYKSREEAKRTML